MQREERTFLSALSILKWPRLSCNATALQNCRPVPNDIPSTVLSSAGNQFESVIKSLKVLQFNIQIYHNTNDISLRCAVT